MKKYIRVFIGNDNILGLDIHDIENHFLLQKYTDKLIYGSMWNDHPFRKEFQDKSIDQLNGIILNL